MTRARSMSENPSSSTVEGGLATQALRFFFSKMAGQTPFDEPLEQERAITAVQRHCSADDAATLFLEYPLAGEGSFDLHVYPSLDHTCSPDADSSAEASSTAQFLHWCKRQPPLLAEGGFAYDLSAQRGAPDKIPEACLYTAFFSKDKNPVAGSFAAMGAAQFAPALQDILSKLEREHSVYYTGVMHGRNPLLAHIGYKVNGALRAAYQSEPRLLFEHLKRMGFQGLDVQREAERFKDYACRDFSNDVQYAFDEAGVIQNTLAFSYVPSLPPNKNRDSLQSGALGGVLEYLQDAAGVADGRWRSLGQALGSWLLPYQSEQGISLGVANISVGYVKIGWEPGRGAVRAKIYVSIQSAPI